MYFLLRRTFLKFKVVHEPCKRPVFLLILLCSSRYSWSAEITPPAVHPPKIYVTKNTCPGECCTYREWHVQKPVTFFAEPNSQIVVGRVEPKQKVKAFTGEIHAEPYPVKVTILIELPNSKTKVVPGETIYLVSPDGEGYWDAWYKNEIISVQDYQTNYSTMIRTKPFRNTWWIKAQLPNGKTGWVIEKGQFAPGDKDSCS